MPVRQHQSRRRTVTGHKIQKQTQLQIHLPVQKQIQTQKKLWWKRWHLETNSDKYVWVTFQILVAEKGRMTSICNIWEIVIEHCRVILGTPDGFVPKNDTGWWHCFMSKVTSQQHYGQLGWWWGGCASNVCTRVLGVPKVFYCSTVWEDGDGVVTSQKNYGQLAWRVVGVPCQHLVPISGKSLLTSVIIIRADQMVCWEWYRVMAMSPSSNTVVSWEGCGCVTNFRPYRASSCHHSSTSISRKGLLQHGVGKSRTPWHQTISGKFSQITYKRLDGSMHLI